jgi:integrase
MADRARRKGRPWSYSTGEYKKTRVRAFERRDKRGLIFLEWREQEERTGKRRRVRIALGHSDRERAKQQADELAVAFRREAKKPPKALTLGAVFQLYAEEVTPTKGESKRAHDERSREMFVRFFGAERRPETLSIRDWQRFITARRSGEVAPKGVKAPKKGEKPRGVRDRVIAYDLKYLLAVLTWAERAGDGRGGTLLERNPLKGLPMPREESPRRPALTAEQYGALRKVAAGISVLFDLALVLAHESGHRIGAIRRLRWSDINLEQATIRWDARSDKLGVEHTTPLTAQAVAALSRERVRTQAIGDAWVFPSPKNSALPCSRFLVRDWWERGAKAAKIPSGQRLAWHSLRRSFASELRNAPLRDLCDLGGWKSPQTVLTCYQRPDEAAQRDALSNRRELKAVGVS